MKKWFFLLFLFAAPHLSFAAIHTETVEYKHGKTVLEGYLVYDDAIAGKRPGVLVVHEWLGLGPYAKTRAEMVARLGYTVLAVDMYGKGIRPRNVEEAGKQSSIYKNDRKLMRARINAGLDVLKKNPLVNPEKIAAIGYCFGGTVVLELARSGAPVKGVVSFHGGLDTPNVRDAKNIKAKVLALHGADDPFVVPKQVENFEYEMRNAGVDWQLISYGGAVHSFTNPASGSDKSKGVAYNLDADRRSWLAMKLFLEEVLA